MIGRWFKAAAVRALKTAAQAALGVFGVTAVYHEIDWVLVGSVALVAAISSILFSLAGIPEVEDGANVIDLSERDDQS